MLRKFPKLRLPSFSALRGSPRLLLLLAVVATCACEEASETTAVRTEPWKKEQALKVGADRQKTSKFRLASAQKLDFELKARKNKSSGTLSGIQGELNLDLKKLDSVSGSVSVDLRELTFNIEGRPSSEKETSPPDANWNDEALLWLGLGSKVKERNKEGNYRATFRFRSADQLSHPSARSGASRKRPDGAPGNARQVYATAIGDLSLGGLSVHRKIPVTLLFIYDEQSASPSRLRVTIRRALRVPLAEYEIRPRDRRGNIVTEKLKLLGTHIGTTAKVTGSLDFELVADAD